MIAQIIRRLSEAETSSPSPPPVAPSAHGGAAGTEGDRGNGGVLPEAPGRFTVVVTGDHSTPVMFGDHSHEPVPIAIAHVRHVVSEIGGGVY